MRPREIAVNVLISPLVPISLHLADLFIRFGNRLRELRQAKGVSQEALADLAGLHRTYVSSVERGERNISLQNIDRLAAALEVSLAELMPAQSKKGK